MTDYSVDIEVTTRIDQLRQLNAEMQRTAQIAKELSTTFSLSNKEARSFAKSIGATAKGFDEYNKRVRQSAKNADDFAKQQAKLARESQKAFDILARSGTDAFRQISDVLSQAVDDAVAFENAIKRVGQITGQTGTPELAELEGVISDLASTTSKTPEQIAQLTIELSRVGFSATESAAAIEGIVKASEGTGSSLTNVGSIVATTIRQFNLSAAQATDVADILLTTANNTNTTIESLGQSLKFAGAEAEDGLDSLQSTAVAIGLLGDSGLRGGIAGRNLATALQRLKIASADADSEIGNLARGSDRARKALEVLDVSFRDTDGSLSDLVTKLPELRAALDSLEGGERDIIRKALFETEGGRAINALLSQTDEQIRDLSDTVSNFEGASVQASEELRAGLSGALVQIDSNLTTLSTTTGQVIAVALEPLARAALGLLQAFNSLPEGVQKTLIAISGVAVTLAGATLALAAYNLAVDANIIKQISMTAAILGNNIQLARQTIFAKAAATAQLALALATGKATRAQQIQAAATGRQLLQYGKLALVIGAVLFAIRAVNTSLEAQSALATDNKFLKELEEGYKKLAAATEEATEATIEYKTRLEEIRAEQNFFQKIIEGIGATAKATENLIIGQEELNKIRDSDAPKTATLAEQQLSAEMLTQQRVIQDNNKAYGDLQAAILKLKSGVGLTRLEIEALNQIVDVQTKRTNAIAEKTGEYGGVLGKTNDLLQDQAQRFRDLVAAQNQAKDSTDELNDSTRNSADAFAQQIADINRQTAERNAAIQEQVASETDKQAQLTESARQGAEERLQVTRDEIANINAELSGDVSTQRKEELETRLTQLQTNAANERTAIAEAEQAARAAIELRQVEVIQQANERALAAATQGETERLIAVQELLNQGLIQKEEAEAQKLEITQNRLRAEIDATQDYIEELENLPQPFNPDDAKSRLDEIASLRADLSAKTLELTEAEGEAIQRLRDLEIQKLQEIAQQQQTNNQIAIDGLGRRNNLLQAQTELINSRASLEQALSEQRQQSIQNEISDFKRAADERKAADEQALEALRQRGASQSEIEQQRAANANKEQQDRQRLNALEDRLFAEKRQSLLAEQAAARQTLELEIQKNQIIQQQNVLRAQGAVIAAKAALAEVEGIEGLERQAAIRRSLVQNAEAQLANTQALSAAQAEVAENSRATLAAQQETALAALDAERANALSDRTLESVAGSTATVANEAERAARAYGEVADNITRSVESQKVLFRELFNQNELLNERLGLEQELARLELQKIERERESLQNQLDSTDATSAAGQQLQRQLDAVDKVIARREADLEAKEAKSLDKQIEAAEAQLKAADAVIQANEALAASVLAEARAIDRRISPAIDRRFSGRTERVEDILQGLGLGDIIGRREGGRVEAGKPYLVGDRPGGKVGRDTELFWPDTSGFIVKASDVKAMLGAMKTPHAPTVPAPITVNGGDSRQLVAAIQGVSKRVDKISTQLQDAKLERPHLTKNYNTQPGSAYDRHDDLNWRYGQL